MRLNTRRLLLDKCSFILFSLSLAALVFSSLASAQTVLFNLKIHSDTSTNLHNEEQVIINPTDPDNIVAVWRDFRLGYRQVGVGYSTDGGTNWTDTLIGYLINPYEWQSDPGITVDRLGNFYAVTLCFDNGGTSAICVYKSTDGGATWQEPSIVVANNVAFEDKELLTCDQTEGIYDGNLYVSWTRFYAGPSTIFVSRSVDGGANWSTPLQISDGIYGTQWSVPAVGANGEVYIAWVQFIATDNLLLRKSTNGGISYSASDTIFTLLTKGAPTINGNILVFPYPALATDISGSPHNGNLYVTYMDKSTLLGDQDIFFSTSTDQGTTWSPRKRINDDLLGNGADQFHPWAAVNQDGVISIAFYDRRNDPSNLSFDVYLTQSYDGGQTFTPNKRVSTVSSYPLAFLSSGLTKTPLDPLTAYYGDKPLEASPLAGLIGEYIGISSYGYQNNLVWTDTREGYQAVYTAKVITKLLIPKLQFPEHVSYVNVVTPLFTWMEQSYYDTASSYELQYSLFDNFSAGVERITGITDTFLILPGNLALADTTYYWRVQSFNASGDSSDYQDVPFSFTVDTDIPDIPGLISPVDTTTDSTPLFTWNSVTSFNKLQNFKPQVASPVRYTWQLANDLGFTINLLEATDLVTPNYQLPNNQALDTGLSYYWRVEANDLASNQSGFSSPLQFEYLAYIRGDVNADHLRNLGDIVYLVNYVFKGGPPPMVSLNAGDVNCNGMVNLGDIVMLVNFVFKGGSISCG